MKKQITFILFISYSVLSFGQTTTFSYGKNLNSFSADGDFVKFRIGIEVSKKSEIGFQYLNDTYVFTYTKDVLGAHYLHPENQGLYNNNDFKRGLFNTGKYDDVYGIQRNNEIVNHFDVYWQYKFLRYESFNANFILSSGLTLNKTQYFAIQGQQVKYTIKEGDAPIIRPFVDKEITNSLGYDVGGTVQVGYDIFKNLNIGAEISLILYANIDAGHLMPSFFIKYNFKNYSAEKK